MQQQAENVAYQLFTTVFPPCYMESVEVEYHAQDNVSAVYWTRADHTLKFIVNVNDMADDDGPRVALSLVRNLERNERTTVSDCEGSLLNETTLDEMSEVIERFITL